MADSRKRKRSWKGLIIAVAVLAVIAVLLLSVLGIFRVREVTVSGNEYYTNEEIADLVIGDGISRNTLYLYFRYQYME